MAAMKMIKKNRAITIGIILTIVAIAILAVVFTIDINVNADNQHKIALTTPTTIYVGGIGPGNYSTIQEGIDAATASDTVFVYSGTYYDNVVINKTLTLIGGDRNTTIIDGNGSGDVIYISADWVNVSGFGVRNSGWQFDPHDSGIDVYSSYNTIANCMISNNYHGIHLSDSLDNIITNNAVYNNSCYGICVRDSSNNNIVSNCTIYNNSMVGIFLVSFSNNNIIINCTISNNSGNGIVIRRFSNNNRITNNTISNDSCGIQVAYSSDNNIITNCTISDNSYYGIYLWDSSNNNYIYHNNFINNVHQSYDDCSNFWDNNYPSGGNYWSDYTGSDLYSGVNQDELGSDGIGDTPYDISGGTNKDRYPLMRPWGIGPVHNLDKDTYYNTIQAAIDDADPGNRIFVSAGIYYENVKINKTLSLIGEDKDMTVIDGNGAGNVVNVTADWVNVSMFTLRNGYRGIYIASSNNQISNCTSYNCSDGMYTFYASNTRVTGCQFYNNSWWGILLMSSSYNQIISCILYNNRRGIYPVDSSYNKFISCAIYNNTWDGLLLYTYSNSNKIINCTFYNNSRGITARESSNNNITNCTVYNNSNDGIYLIFSSNNNQITYCNITGNTNYGVHIYYNPSSQDADYPSNYNVFHHNNFINNNVSTYDVCNNSWDNGYPSEGNYWSDYDEPAEGAYDNNTDGIVDTPYAIPGGSNYDNYPFMEPSGWEEVGLTPHDSISINGNADFASQASNEGWAGDGTINNPYIIENWDINASSADGIYIGNTTAYFIIRNCTVHDGKSTNNFGIFFYNMTNGKIDNVTSYNNYYGIYLRSSSNNQVSNCSVYNNDDAIWLKYSSVNQITNCSVYNNSGDGICLYESSNNQITNCTVYNNYRGICLDGYLGECNYNQITNCNVYNNYVGIYLSYSSNNLIYNNYFNNTNNAYSSGGTGNRWNITKTAGTNIINGSFLGGNYWSDYNGSDANGDGIGDTPYYIPGGNNKDNYPFMEPSGWEEKPELMPHEPIYIKGNDDFVLENGVVSGSGIESDPYIIEGYDINAGTTSYPGYAGVHIENTDAYFIIRNCIIHDGYEEDIRYNYGIYFYNVTNGEIENVTSYNNYYGIFLYYSSANNITKCIVYNNSGYGVSLYYSSNNTITNCTVYNNSWYGIELYECANSTVTNCTIYNNSYGISLSRSLNCKVENCTVYNHAWSGISVSSQSSNNQIVNCVVYNNSYYGIQISSSVCNVVVNCSVYNNSRYGIYSSYSQYNQIANSILYNNTYYNIYLSSSLYDQITNCILYNSNYGAYFYSCLYDKIVDCTFYNNRYYGIYFTSSLYNQITNNRVINCSTGICFYFSFYNQITNCALNSNSNSGGYFQFSSNNTVTRCNISANYWGFYFYLDSNNNYIYHNSFINNTNNAYDEGINYWDCNGEGNHWGNYTGTDNNGDCIGDLPYSISGGNNKDNYPLMHEFIWWDTEIPVISLVSPDNNSVIKPGTVLEFDITDDNLWKASYSVNNGVIQYFSSPYNISTDGWENGIYNITVYAKDWGMNEISKMFIFIIDGTPPTVTITEENQIINITSFTMHWTTNATDIQYYEISMDGSRWLNVGTNTSYTFTNLVEGFNTLHVRGIDLVNNAGTPSSITIVVEIPISEEIAPHKEEINWLLYGTVIIAIFIALMLSGAGITGVRRAKRRKVLHLQRVRCVYCQETTKITSRDRPLLFQCPKCGRKSVIR